MKTQSQPVSVTHAAACAVLLDYLGISTTKAIAVLERLLAAIQEHDARRRNTRLYPWLTLEVDPNSETSLETALQAISDWDDQVSNGDQPPNRNIRVSQTVLDRIRNEHLALFSRVNDVVLLPETASSRGARSE